MNRVLVTGSSRGLGFEFARQYACDGWEVIATCRDPAAAADLQTLARAHPNVRPHRLDVADETGGASLASALAAAGSELDLLIHNAAIFASGEEGLDSLDRRRMLEVFDTNVVAPAALTRQLRALLRPGAVVAGLVSGAGVLRPPSEKPMGQFSYGASKAAFHLLLSRLAHELRPQAVAVVGLAPGFVLTDMTRGSANPPPLRPPESVAGMRAVLARITLAETGRFFGHDGRECDWFAG